MEVKNVNSIDNVKRALEYEIERQSREPSVLETRHFDETFGTTISLRVKETVADYRYMPDPDVPPMLITKEMIDAVRMPEDLYALRERLVLQYGIDNETSAVLTSEQELAGLFERMARINPIFAADWMRRDLKGELNYRSKLLKEVKIDEKQLTTLITDASSGKVTRLRARDILRDYLDGKRQMTEGLVETIKFDLDAVVDEVLLESADLVEKYKSGKTAVINAIIGKVSAKVKKAADANAVKKKIEEKLS